MEKIYISEITGKHLSRAMYIQTKDFKFLADVNIVQEEDFIAFKGKYDKVKKVKIKYLPNSNELLDIEPVD